MPGGSQCQCESCSPGNPGETFTQVYMLACEAITLLQWPLETRREFLAQVEKRRGVEGRRALESAMTEQWERRKQ